MSDNHGVFEQYHESAEGDLKRPRFGAFLLSWLEGFLDERGVLPVHFYETDEEELRTVAAAIDHDAEALDAEAEERGARVARVSIRRQVDVAEHEMDAPQHGERLRRYAGEMAHFQGPGHRMVPRMNEIANAIDWDAATSVSLDDHLADLIGQRDALRQCVEELIEELRLKPEIPGLISADALLSKLDGIFGKRPDEPLGMEAATEPDRSHRHEGDQ